MKKFTEFFTITLVFFFLFTAIGSTDTLTIPKIKKSLYNNQLDRIFTDIKNNLKNSLFISLDSQEKVKYYENKSKFGGTPDLPINFKYPEWKGRPLSFLAQINLEEARSFDKDKLLPEKGMLYFFYDPEQETWGYDPNDKGSFIVYYYNGNISELKKSIPPISLKKVFPSYYLKFRNEISLPDFGALDTLNLNLSEQEEDSYAEVENELSDGVIHKLLGYPNSIQDDMQLECELVSHGLYCGDASGYDNPKAKLLGKNKGEWILLLQIDSDEKTEMLWGDSGRIYFWIRKPDLKNRNFNQVWMILQSY